MRRGAFLQDRGGGGQSLVQFRGGGGKASCNPGGGGAGPHAIPVTSPGVHLFCDTEEGSDCVLNSCQLDSQTRQSMFNANRCLFA